MSARGGATAVPGGVLRRMILSLCLILGACAPIPERAGAPPSRAVAMEARPLPPMQVFAAPAPVPPQRANRDMLRDFLDLSFEMESGQRLERFSRFEGPVTVRVTGPVPATLIADLDRLLARLRREAGLDIRRGEGAAANITIAVVSREEIRRALPSAACFVVPNLESLAQYRATRRSAATDWTRIARREMITVFLPGDASPQEIRDCLHEELAQALGPLNDLYRLPDSVFNDDNVHAVLTGFDMLMLRVTYAPELRAGMTRDAVAARLPAILRRLNPAGEMIAPRRIDRTPRAWNDAIQTALGPGARAPARRKAAVEALAIAQARGWRDHRRAFSHFALGRLMQADDPDAAQAQFRLAERIYAQMPGAGLHRAFVVIQLASHAIAEAHGAQALALLDGQGAIAERFENAALLATLLMLKADALDLEGRDAQAQAARLDSLGWARYGYGITWAVQAGLRGTGPDIASAQTRTEIR